MLKQVLSRISQVAVLIVLASLLSGCEYSLFDPKGPIGQQQKELIIFSILIMLIVVVPVIFMNFWFPWKYRSKNHDAQYEPYWEHSNKIEFFVWLIPILIIIVLGIITYKTSFSLDPRKPIESDKPTMVVQVVALDWKWLFIYPEQGIATVNEMAMPLDTPVEFLVTSESAMNAFSIPQLGSMVYAMSGMENRVHLMASEEGDYRGMSGNYSGFGFTGMRFKALARSDAEFDAWVAKVKAEGTPLTDEVYTTLTEKSKDVAPIYYSTVNPLLFNSIIEKFTGAINGQ